MPRATPLREDYELDLRRLRNEVVLAFRTLSDNGLSVPSTGRHQCHLNLIDAMVAQDAIRLQRFRPISQAINREKVPPEWAVGRAIQELERLLVIVRWGLPLLLKQSWGPKTIFKGAQCPEDDPQPAKGRDLEFEAFVGACLARSGLFPQAVEPDYRIRLPSGREISLAVKRCSSGNRLLDLGELGLGQIGTSELPGVLLLNASRLVDWAIDGRLVNEPLDVSDTLANAVAQRLSKHLVRGQEQPNLIGITGHIETLHLRPGVPFLLAGSSWKDIWLKENSNAHRDVLIEFHDVFQNAPYLYKHERLLPE